LIKTDQFVTEVPQPNEPSTRLKCPPRPEAFEISILDPTCDPRWERLVASHPGSSFFHSAAWTRVLCKTYAHKPVSLLLFRSGEPAALVPLLEVSSPLTGRRGVCLPFTDSCDPLVFAECDFSILSRLLCDLANSRNWKYCEIRGGSTSAPPIVPSVRFYGHTLDLRSSVESLFSRLKSSARGAIRKAERSGLTVDVTRSPEAIREYYRLHVQTRKRHGLPPQPLSFFINIYDAIIKAGMGFIVKAHSGSRVAAAAVFFQIGKKAVYKFSASDEALRQLQGNSLIVWKAIQSLAQNGVEELHFGRTALEDEGLRKFKLAWGTCETTIEYFRFNSRTDKWLTGQKRAPGRVSAVFARLPLALNRFIGTMIYPHLD
jgi:hypothetical protein